jgi:hypothetical protein
MSLIKQTMSRIDRKTLQHMISEKLETQICERQSSTLVHQQLCFVFSM